MKRFDKDKYLRKIKVKKWLSNYSRYLYLGLSCIFICVLGIYLAYSKFFISKEEVVIKTTVGNFIQGDVVIDAYINGEYSSIIPTKSDGYVVDKVVCDNGATGEWNNDKWGLFTTNISKRTKCNLYFITKPVQVVEKVTTLAKNDTTNFASDDPGKNIRYTGANPDNYIYFNCSDYANQSDSTCEKWRIIGVFNNMTKADGSKENLIKIIRDDSLGNLLWDSKQNGVGSSTADWGSNDWTDSQLMMMLNPIDYLKNGYTNSNDIISYNNQEIYSKMGSYYNGTKGCQPASIASGSTFTCTEIDFTSNGLKNADTRNAIETVVWNLGGTASYSSSSNGLASHWYSYERGTKVHSGRPTTWIGKIGLMYPSDYGYATSGGSTSDRQACLAKELYSWDSSSVSDCKNNDYLFKLSYSQWTLAPDSSSAYSVFSVFANGWASYVNADYAYGVRPAAFLKFNISIMAGTGTSSEPYQLKVN